MGFKLGNGSGDQTATTPLLSLLLGGAQTATKTAGAVSDYSTQAGVASTNAALERMSAEDATQRGEEQAQKYGRAFSQAFGQTQSQIIGSGTDSTQGSALNRLNDLREGGALDQLTIRNNAANEAYLYNQKADQSETESQLDKLKAKTSLSSGILTGGLNFVKWSGENIKGLSDLGGAKAGG
jgi:hypothetical protein